MTSIVAVMGYDWRHVVRSILRIGFGGCSSIHLLLPPWEDERSTEGVGKVREIALAAGMSEDRIRVHRVNILDFRDAVLRIARLYMRILAEDDILLSLGGGMRALVAEALAAAIMMSEKSWRERIRVVIDLEGREESVAITVEDIASIRLYPPTARELEAVKLAVERGVVTPKTLAETIRIPLSTAHATLKSAENKGLLEKVGWGKYRPTELGKTTLKIYRENTA